MLIEFVTMLALLTAAVLCRGWRLPLARGVSRRFRRVARRPVLAPAIIAVTAFGWCACLSLCVSWPEPAVHDEFSYLLGADTFVQGRCTNPTHPLWEHFETYGVISVPSYQSKYPPGQALALAAGQMLGHPLVGVWVSLSAACGAVCWMLRAWMPPRWAFGGAGLVLLNPEVIRWWGQTYWGGAVAMLGGAMVFGALPRLLRNPRPRMAVVLGVGLSILANSRPYEGLVVSLPAVGALFVWFVSGRGLVRRDAVVRVVLPLMLILALAATAMGYYNYRITGNALRLPYQVYHEQYFGKGRLWEVILPAGKTGTDEAKKLVVAAHRPGGLQPVPIGFTTPQFMLLRQWRFYVRFTLSLPLLALFFARPDRSAVFAAMTVGLVVAAVLVLDYAGYAHYTAPAVGLFTVLLVRGLRLLRAMGRHRCRAAGNLFRLIVMTVFPLFVVHVAIYARHPCEPFLRFSLSRAEIRDMLLSEPGRHLVLVRYSADHRVYHEWVHNGADIDAGRIVWARELSPEQNRRLLQYYRDRTVWLVEADEQPPRLQLVRAGAVGRNMPGGP